jgi:hypothetical protein
MTLCPTIGQLYQCYITYISFKLYAKYYSVIGGFCSASGIFFAHGTLSALGSFPPFV